MIGFAMDSSPRLNGFKPKSYGDLVAIASLMSMFMSVVLWGLKLEARNDSLRTEIFDLKSQVGNGILPRAEERIVALERRVQLVERHLDAHSQ